MSIETTDSDFIGLRDGFERRSWSNAVARGLMCRCPSCGQGRLFGRYLKVADECNHCGEELHHHCADDAPPYFTIFIVGHIVVPLMLIVERLWRPEVWIHLALWMPLTIVLSVLLLPCVKGGVVGLQWALRMHGFDYSANPEIRRGVSGDEPQKPVA